GKEVYKARTFSHAHRYDSNVLNSYGHSVPLVADTLQVRGRAAAAKIISTNFTDDEDTLVMDITAPYNVPDLKKLVRTFVFSRKGKGKLTISDQVEFEHPQAFGTALITFSKWKKTAPDHLEIGQGNDIVDVLINVTGGEFKITEAEIAEKLPRARTPLRLGIDIAEPVKQATITTTVTPKW
ncbi:MAG: hypothetical protein ACWGMZ_09345, partial [Thermoguttaceae bacterium]